METKLASFFHVVEGFEVFAKPLDGAGRVAEPEVADPHSMAAIEMVGVAVWMRSDESDSNHDFDYELALDLPGIGEKVLTRGQFKFRKTFQRFPARVRIGKSPPESGLIRFVSRIRQSPEGSWLSQEFPIPLTVNLPESDT